MTGFQRLCLLTGAAVFLLILVGGVVRATGSGLGCPDWPRCHGSFIPTTDKHTLIEYSHRLTGFVTGLLGLSVLIAAWRSYRHVPAIWYVTCLGFVLGLTQAGLGGAVVKNELPPGIVAIHLALALTILTLLLLLIVTAFALDGRLPVPAVGRGFGRLALLASAGTLALMLVGAFVSASHYGLACNGWPLCNGDVVPNLNANSTRLIFLHRLLAAVLGVVIVALVWQAWRVRVQSPFIMRIAGLALAVYLLQAIVGAANVWTRLADEVDAAHLALATVLWATLALLNIRVHRLHELLPMTETGHRDALAGVAR